MMASATKELTMSSSFSPKAGTSKRQRHPVTTDASPDSKCPICLDRFDNMSYLDRCLHRFCFRCIQEWSKNKAECPLCKQPFHSIFHSVRAEDDFKEYILRPSQNGSFGSPDGHRFRYRTTLTRERRTPVRSHRSTSVRRTLSPPDNGILFEGLVGQTNIQRDEGIHQMIRQFASRRQTSTEGRPSRHDQEQDIINFRRALYRSGVRVRSIQDGGRYRDISAEFFRHNPACLHRLVPWLKRELLVLFGAHGSLVNIVQHIIMSNVTRYDLESQTFAEDLKPFLLHRTDHFLHEFISFARCPYNIDAYDLHANYDYPAPSYEEGSHSDSSVITISPEECDSRDPDLLSSEAGTGQTPWDDETPGPSYSTLEPAPTTVSSLVDTSESSDEESTRRVTDTQVEVKVDPGLVGEAITSSTDDCVIVGFIKPLAERTPELVELSSDSEESLYEEKIEDKKLQQLQLSPFSENSDSSTSSSPSSTGSKGRKTHKTKQNQTSSFSSKFGSLSKEEKDKGKRTCDLLPSKNCVRKSSAKKQRSYISKKRERSRSPNPISHLVQARDQRNRRTHHSKERHRSRSSRSWENTHNRDRRDNGRLMIRDRSLSRRSQTVSLTSESSISREEVRSGSRSSDRGSGRSRSRDSDYGYPADNYKSTYRWEYTYYNRNRERDGFDRSCRRKTRGKGYYQRRSTSPDFRIQHYSERKHTQSQRCHNKTSQHYRERFRSRSHSSNRSRMTVGGAERIRNEKPSGKRKYKTRHLEHANQINKTSHQGTLNLKGKENRRLKSPLGHSSHYNEDDLSDSRASSESRHKRKKKARSSSVEIVYEGKTTAMSRHHKKKKKKQKKKHKRHHAASSIHTSPVVITINSDSEKEDMDCDDGSNWAATNLSNESEREVPSGLAACQRKDAFDVDLVSKDDHCAVSDEGGSDVSDKDAHIVTSNMNLEAATGILDDFHFDESSNEETFTVVDSIGSDSGLDTSSTVIEGTPADQPSLSSSTRTACEENSLERPQLILRLPKSLIEKNYLFDHLGKKT
uniref:E3 ubiquitin-protein ligase Topors n=1 Tax=Geotrypetes seraphini TaxID=260995 RepID=A0A6P8PF27_GEOSA|nr:E3 ubiquitin-protein ligase Topors [Geotrypetes seraphini]XP_033782537.1 E3 ubiquitin-protein ligase Topors [Geotrypetes seraphini]XP_033782549.1 E3 ubiquitin-protein ligase Topors [Geotrypetes seraphini]XP_033782557.1 E3 ubiquitin-protein ligase Topors [Geotrypetes seraphini]XP_033782566.1 E3 ubiquitin-protein ligase Topors [Geotrypetes seraphini]XP_033782573.1 E3 ubiquitin-protein ligase Topors [Geotrypetes seraphini]XP_033782582.1 E3 ubiquitin-protein ligase Topors [Geotrypetes seraphin